MTSGGWGITEQIRTVSAERFRRYASEITLGEQELEAVRRVLAQMLFLDGCRASRRAGHSTAGYAK